MFNNGLSPLTKAPFSTIVTPFVCRKLRQYLNLSVGWMFLLLFRSMNKQENRGFYISRIYVNAIQDGSHAQASLFPDWLLCFSSRCYIAFGQLDNAQLRDRFGQFRRRLSVIYVAVRALMCSSARFASMARASSRSWPRIAVSARTVTLPGCTSRMPPDR